MKPGTVILIGIGAISLYFVSQGQKAAAGGEKSPGILPGINLPSVQFPSVQFPSVQFPELTMPEFAFTMPEFTFNMPEFQTPQALGDVGQQITDALTGFLAGLGAGLGEGAELIPQPVIHLPDLPGLPGVGGVGGEPGFFGYLGEAWRNLERTASAAATGATQAAQVGAKATSVVATGAEVIIDASENLISRRWWEWLPPVGLADQFMRSVTGSGFMPSMTEFDEPVKESQPILEPEPIPEGEPSALARFLTL